MLKGVSTFIFFILAIAFSLALIGHPIHSQETIIFLFMFLITGLPAIYLAVAFLYTNGKLKPPIPHGLFFSPV